MLYIIKWMKSESCLVLTVRSVGWIITPEVVSEQRREKSLLHLHN